MGNNATKNDPAQGNQAAQGATTEVDPNARLAAMEARMRELEGEHAALHRDHQDLVERFQGATDENENLRATNADLANALQATQAEASTLQAQLDNPAERPARFVAKVDFHVGGGRILKRGSTLPFDPTDPPPGFTGFVRDTHYTIEH
jgi:chromosome segregation ATPase